MLFWLSKSKPPSSGWSSFIFPRFSSSKSLWTGDRPGSPPITASLSGAAPCSLSLSASFLTCYCKFFILRAFWISVWSESILVPVKVVIFPMHIKNETRMHTKNSNAENMPVRMRKASVGSRSSFSVSVLKDFFGIAIMISRVITGKSIAKATMRLGVGEQSLKKQMIKPMIPKMQTTIVPCPTPSTRPS